jgi:hypothetical protein
VTEAEWDGCNDPAPMLKLLGDYGRASERKLRLFVCGGCRNLWSLLTDERSKRAVEVAERYADGLAGKEELTAASAGADSVWDEALVHWHDPTLLRRERVVFEAAMDAAGAACWAASEETSWGPAAWAVEKAGHLAPGEPGGRSWWAPSQGALSERDALAARSPSTGVASQVARLRCIFGPLAFRPMVIDPPLLGWNAGAIVRLAQAIYDDRLLPSGHLDAARLAVLADMLEEAGCTDTELLGHLRSPGPHVRGCFAIDVLTGRS